MPAGKKFKGVGAQSAEAVHPLFNILGPLDEIISGTAILIEIFFGNMGNLGVIRRLIAPVFIVREILCADMLSIPVRPA